jgi:hypothetical protein
VPAGLRRRVRIVTLWLLLRPDEDGRPVRLLLLEADLAELLKEPTETYGVRKFETAARREPMEDSMSSEELRERVAAIKPGDTVTARFDEGRDCEFTVTGRVREEYSNLIVGASWLALNGQAANNLLAIESHEPAKPPVPPEPTGDVIVRDCLTVLWEQGQAANTWESQGGTVRSWDDLAGKRGGLKVYRPEPSPERIEELVQEFWVGLQPQINARNFVRRLLGGEQ